MLGKRWHRPDVGPKLARHWPNIGLTSARHLPDAGQMPDWRIGPASAQRWADANGQDITGPTLGQRRADDGKVCRRETVHRPDVCMLIGLTCTDEFLPKQIH